MKTATVSALILLGLLEVTDAADLVKTGGQLGAFLVVVLMFLKHLGKRDETTQKLATDGHESVRKLADTLHETNLELSQNTEVTSRLVHVVEKIENKQQ